MNRTMSLLGGLLCLAAAGCPTASAQSVTIDQIQKVWAEREARAKTLRASISTRDFIPQGHFTAEYGPSMTKNTTQPAKDTELLGTSVLLLDGPHGRIDEQSEVWSLPDGRGLKVSAQSVIKSGVSQCFTDQEATKPGQYTTQLIKNRSSQSNPLRSYSIHPLLLAFRGANSLVDGWNLATFSVKGMADASGRPCVHLAEGSVAGNTSTHLYLDSECDYLTVRVELRTSDRLTYQCDVTNRRDPSAGWVPSEWRVAMPSSPASRQHMTVRLTSLELGVATTKDDFDLRPPPGTRVIDLADPGREVHALVRADGSSGEPVTLVPGTYPSRAVLAAANRDHDLARWRWAVVAGGSVVLATVATVASRWLVRSRLRLKPSSTGDRHA